MKLKTVLFALVSFVAFACSSSVPKEEETSIPCTQSDLQGQWLRVGCIMYFSEDTYSLHLQENGKITLEEFGTFQLKGSTIRLTLKDGTPSAYDGEEIHFLDSKKDVLCFIGYELYYVN